MLLSGTSPETCVRQSRTVIPCRSDRIPERIALLGRHIRSCPARRGAPRGAVDATSRRTLNRKERRALPARRSARSGGPVAAQEPDFIAAADADDGARNCPTRYSPRQPRRFGRATPAHGAAGSAIETAIFRVRIVRRRGALTATSAAVGQQKSRSFFHDIPVGNAAK